MDNLAWPVVVDDYEGTIHRQYSAEMADPSFLVDAEGDLAFYGMWTHIPTLKRAIDELLARDGRGTVAGGTDRQPHLAASFVDGYRGLRRGGRRAVLEFDLGSGGGGTMSFLGHKAKPLLEGFALNARPRSER
jgi:hypothetical protein